MKKALFGVIAAATAFQVTAALACTSDGKEGIAPKNDLYIPVSKFAMYTISKDDFFAVTDKAQKYFAPVFESQGREYKVVADWEDGTVNAYADRVGKVSEVHMFGGLARHSKMTKDGFTLVICHETGHHLGGAPRKDDSWASNEGQADYYATVQCARAMWKDEDNASVVASMTIPTIVKDACSKSFSSANDVAICERASMAGKDLGDTLGDLGGTGDTDFSTPDTSVVTQTDDEHPAAQCRLDTYFGGAICAKTFTDIMDKDDVTKTGCSQEIGDAVGVRPLCWYKPTDRTGGGGDGSGTGTGDDDGGSSWPSSTRIKRRVVHHN